MNSQLLITTIVQQTMVFIAQLATASGVRAPLVRVADDLFLGLTRELAAQGLTKQVIADMFGMGLRTYHRRVQALEQSKSFDGKTVWEVRARPLAVHRGTTRQFWMVEGYPVDMPAAEREALAAGLRARYPAR